MKHGECKLCHNISDLCESHIIPDFIFRYIRTCDKQIVADINSPPKAFYHDQSYKEHLLCLKCEKIIKKYEDYARDILFDFKRASIFINETEGKIYYKNIDYLKFKNYLLSVIWRVSISNIKMFSNIKLSHDEENKIRCIILNNDKNVPNYFGCEIVKFYDERIEGLNKNIDYCSIFIQPYFESSGKIFFVYGGHIWIYKKINDSKSILNESGSMVVNKKSIRKYPVLINTIEVAILGCKKVGKFGKNK